MLQKNSNIIKKHRRSSIFIIILSILILLGVVSIVVLKTSPFCKYYVKDKLNLIFPDKFSTVVYYQNNVPYYSTKGVDLDNNDVREVWTGNNRRYLTNHSRGFSLSFPRDAEFDFSTAQEFITVKCKNMTAVVSKEYSTYEKPEETRMFIKDYLHKYMLDERYIEQNKLTIHKNSVEKIDKYWVQIVALSRTPAPDSPIKENTYVYCYVYNYSTMFYRIMFRAEEYNEELMEEVYRTLYSFDGEVAVRGVSGTYTDYKPIIPDFWSDETKDYYNNLVNSNEVKWGIYTPSTVVHNDFSEITKLEEKLGANFDGVLEYLCYIDDIPLDGIKTAYENGKIVELTLQTSTVMNEQLDGYNPVFDIIDGIYDEKLKEMALSVKSIGHPVLFRLNNEMNSDWTSYSASACLTDPHIYVTLWRKIYNLFKENGVDNAIWIFNPNNESFPPCGYNSSLAFYPGNEYVQVFGITGYNTGTYYAELNNEKWKTFKELYDEIINRESDIYGKFPWIITEFASSSYGGDKAEWISNMFEDIKKYPNIKMAFWFNSADYDTRPGKEKIPARPYWIDETQETLKAFADGMKKH